MSIELEANTIPGTHWKRPPLNCPQCMEPLISATESRVPPTGQEYFGTRCGHCGTILRLVKERFLPTNNRTGLDPQLAQRPIWVPMLLGDRRSRIVHRMLWEPSEVAWPSMGGSAGRTNGFSDPAALVCDYPAAGDQLSVHHAYQVRVGDRPLVSLSYAEGQLWALDQAGDLTILADVNPSSSNTTPPTVLGRVSLHDDIEGASFPPAHRGAWWMILGNRGRVRFIFRDPAAPSPAQWRGPSDTLPNDWTWVGAPFVIDRPDTLPLFAAMARSPDDHADTRLYVYQLPDSVREATSIQPKVIRIPGAINTPVQIPTHYALEEDTRRGKCLGALAWLDRVGAVRIIDTRRPLDDWDAGTPFATAQGRTAANAAPPPPAPPFHYFGPGEPATEPYTRLTAAEVAARLQNAPTAAHHVIVNGAWMDARLEPSVAAALAAASAPLIGTTDTILANGDTFLDELMVTVERFASPNGPAGTGGIRLWSIQRNELDPSDISVRVLCLEGGPDAERHWLAPFATSTAALASARKRQSGKFSLSTLPVHAPSPQNERGRRADAMQPVLVLASHEIVSIFKWGETSVEQQRHTDARETDDELVCAPIVTPYGVVLVWKSLLELWPYDRQQQLRAQRYPPPQVTLSLEGRQTLDIRSGHHADTHRLHPVVIGNRIWLPSDTGTVHCLDMVPVREG